ncbi:MAG: hypothetical protein ACLTEH_05445, partial [Clostridia bacterium]
VYHQHTGSVSTGGGCYTKVIYHTHTGNSSTNGGCYTLPVYHAHSSSCYATCGGQIYIEWKGGTDGWVRWNLKCSKCGAVGYRAWHPDYNSPCPSDGEILGNGRCTGSIISCGKTAGSTIDSYGLNCGKTAGSTIEGYQIDCGKIAGTTIESYDLNCGKTPGTSIDSYDLGCYLNDGQIVSYTICY